MFIITDNNNKIMHISETIGYQNNGNVLINNDSQAIAKNLVKGVFEVENISEGIETDKYCYTEEKGFYENVDYTEPFNEKVEIEQLKEQITELQLAMVEREV